MTNTVFYTPKEVAEILRVKKPTVIRLILKGDLACTIVGKQYRISEEHLQDYYKRNTTQTV